MAVAAFDKDAREELDEINVFLANVSEKVAPEKLDGQGAEINVFANAVAVAAFEKVTREELDGQGTEVNVFANTDAMATFDKAAPGKLDGQRPRRRDQHQQQQGRS